MPPDPYKYFRIEGRELVEQLGRGVLGLEKGVDPELVSKLLRYAHTLKGAARVVKQAQIATLAHRTEEVLTPLRTAVASHEQVDQLLGLLDQIRTLLAELEPPGERPPSTRPRAPDDQLAAEPLELDSLLAGLSQASVQLQGLRRRSLEVELAKRSAERIATRLAAPHAEGAERARPASEAEELRSQLALLEEGLSRGIDSLQQEIRGALNSAERLRLLPAGTMLGTLERIARDAARELGKQVVLRFQGEEIRLEAAVLLKVQRALVQLVRNAVAHGIEDEQSRKRLSKPAPGTIDLRVARRGNRVAFVCRDDGRGIDFQALARSARARGLLAAGANPSPEELRRLLLGGGHSTSRDVTEVAGRGVGLDVVREEIAELGGTIDLRSTEGQGAEFELLVPISLASLEALLVEAAGHTVAIPLNAVRRAFRLSPADVTAAASGERVVTQDGRALPLISLAEVLGSDRAASLPPSALVVSAGQASAAVSVDRVLGNANIVLRPLPRLVAGNPVAMGATLDEDGNPRLVLDEDRLIAHRQPEKMPMAATPKRRPILVVDDSVTTRMLEQSILESAGYEVALAASAEEGLEMARRRAYGLFLVDVEMPGMDGFGFVERTRVESRLRDTPAILVTSRNAPEDRARGREVGAFSYIVKSSFDQTELLELVRRMVG